jgi:phosphoglucomutase
MAKHEGFKFVECLTGEAYVLPIYILFGPDLCFYAGFKYIGNTALDLVQDGFEVPFGYEEAIGFMFGSDVRDKDGVAATVCLDFTTSLIS